MNLPTHARLLEADALRVGHAAGRVHHEVGLEHATKLGVDLERCLAAPLSIRGGDDAADLRLGAHLDAHLLGLGPQHPTDRHTEGVGLQDGEHERADLGHVGALGLALNATNERNGHVEELAGLSAFIG